MEQWVSPNTLCDTKMILPVSLNIGKLVAEWLSPNILIWYKGYIMKEKIDLSLNRSLEELIDSYWEAEEEGINSSDFYALEDYLSNFGAI